MKYKQLSGNRSWNLNWFLSETLLVFVHLKNLPIIARKLKLENSKIANQIATNIFVSFSICSGLKE